MRGEVRQVEVRTTQRRIVVALFALAMSLALCFTGALPAHAADAAAGKGALTTAASAAKPATGPIPNGDYVLRSALSNRAVADVAGNSKKENANVQLYAWNKTTAQKWHFVYNANGYYTITSKTTGKALTAVGAKNKANVCMRASRNTAGQRWYIESGKYGYVLRNGLNKAFVLDVNGAKSKNGTNIQVYKANGTKAQAFSFVSLGAAPKSNATIAAGAYTMRFASGKYVDVNGASLKSGANVAQYQGNGSYAQKFWIEPDGKGYYRIFNIGSGLALDVSGADVMPGANVQQYNSNGTAAQLWSISKGKKGYTIACKSGGNVLTVSGASTKNSANIVVDANRGATNQEIELTKTTLLPSDGAVILKGAFSTGRAIDVPGASKKANTQLQMYTANSTAAQKLLVRAESGGKYSLQIVGSGLYLGMSGNSVVQQSSKYLWSVGYGTKGARRGVIFRTAAGSTAITAAGTGQSAKLTAVKADSRSTQLFLPAATDLIPAGYYTVGSALGARVLDVAGASKDNGANLQIYTSNHSSAQVFYISSAGGGYYQIVNANSNRAVETTAKGDNVVQYAKSSDASQLWKAQLNAGGSFTFTNKKSGLLLSVANNKNADGANVVLAKANNGKGQLWNLTASSASSNYAVEQRALAKIKGKSSATRYMIAVDLSKHYVVVFKGARGAWKVVRTMQCTNGAASTPTVTGDFTVGSRGYSFGDGRWYTCYYWTQFYGDYLFHSVLYHKDTRKILDGALGKYKSHGCVRLQIDNAKWIYDNIPSGTHVYVYN